jgi:hypothetical protein
MKKYFPYFRFGHLATLQTLPNPLSMKKGKKEEEGRLQSDRQADLHQPDRRE